MPQGRRPSQAEINAMRRKELKTALENMIRDEEQREAVAADRTVSGDGDAQGGGRVEILLQSILDEMKKMNAANELRDVQIQDLQESHAMMKKIVVQQQKFLEMMDQDRRAANVIVLGVPEDDNLELGEDLVASTVEEKCQGVLEKIGALGIQVHGEH